MAQRSAAPYFGVFSLTPISHFILGEADMPINNYWSDARMNQLCDTHPKNNYPKMTSTNFKRKKVDSDVVLNDTVVIEILRNLEEVIMPPRTPQFIFVLYKT